jgi:ribosomal protein S6
MEDELQYTRNAINILENRLIIKDSVISTLIFKENAYKSVFENYKKTISNNEQVVENLNKALTLEKRKFRKQGISKWIGAAGAFTLGVLIAK